MVNDYALKQSFIKKLNNMILDKSKFIIPEMEKLEIRNARQCSSGVVYNHPIDIKGSCWGPY